MLTMCCRLACVTWIVFASGCAMCQSCDDYTYPASGGRWQRLDPVSGRVGSAFTPEVGARVDGELAAGHPESVTPREPTPAEDPAELPPSWDSMPGTSVLESNEVMAR